MSAEDRTQRQTTMQLLFRNLLLAASVFGATLAGQPLSLQNELPPIVWLSCGIALAFFLLYGIRMWPGLVIGLLASFLTVGEPFGFSVIHVLAHLAGTFSGYYFLVWLGFKNSFRRIQEALNFIALGVFGSSLITVMIFAAGLVISSKIEVSRLAFLEYLEIQWLAKVLGLLVITPLLLTWNKSLNFQRSWQTVFEALTLAAGLVIATLASFFWFGTPHVASFPFIIFPFIIWAALRFKHFGAAITTLVISAIAIAGTINNWAVFAWPYSPQSQVLFLQAFLSIVAVTGLLLASVSSEREDSLVSLKDSASRYRSLFETNPQLMLVYRLNEGLVIEANKSAVERLGYENSQVQQLSILDLLGHTEENPITDSLLELAEDEARHIELSLVAADDEMVLCNCTLQNIYYAGETYGLLIAEDVTEQIKTRETLRDMEQKLTLHKHQTALGVIEWTPDFRIVDWNPAAEKIFGYSAKEIVGQTGDAILPESAKADVHELWSQLIVAQGGTYSVNVNMTKDGREIICEWFNTPLINREGQVIGVESVTHDITAREHAEEALRESESKFRSIIESSPMGIHIFQLQQETDELILIGANSAADRILGMAHAERMGLPIDKALPDMADTEVPERYLEVARSGKPWDTNQVTYINNDAISVYEITAFNTSHGTVVAMFLDVTERRNAEQTLKLREKAMESITQGIIIQIHKPEADHPIIYANPAFHKITGYSSEELMGKTLKTLFGAVTEEAEQAEIEEAMFEKHSAVVDIQLYRKDATYFQSSLSISPIKDENNAVTHFVTVVTDVSALRTLEVQFRQSQKMDAVGRLAGGVAHDFNNLLTAIIGYNDQIIEELPENTGLRDNAIEVQRAAERASNLTKQLLAFSRQQSLQPKVIDLNDIISGMQNMLARLIGEDIEIRTELAKDLYPVKCEPSQIEQVIMNMAINARDAMSGSGVLALRTSMLSIRDTAVNAVSGLSSGDYTVLSISDTGCGMSRDVQEHLFEPFFTTKEKGKGTGLGLATCYGIIKQNSGLIQVQSAPGKGSTFSILLPAMDRPRLGDEQTRASTSKLGGLEHILVVEDDDAVRPLTTSILKSLGYSVTEAADGLQAISIIESKPTLDFDLIITDMVMPKMGGREMAEQLRRKYPMVSILFTSGYIDSPMSQLEIGGKKEFFLQKPFTPMDLARKVRNVLDLVNKPTGKIEPIT